MLATRNSYCTLRLRATCDKCCMHIMFLLYTLGKVVIKVFSCITKGRKNDNLLVIAVYWVSKLMAKVIYQL